MPEMLSTETYEYLDSDSCAPGSYLITTANGSIYRVDVSEAGTTTMQRSHDAAPDGHRSDTKPIPVLGWVAFRDNRGALFYFYGDDAPRHQDVDDYICSVRHTSAVTAIERIDSLS